MNNIIEEFKLYQDKWGLSQIRSKDGIGETTQNGSLFTIQYVICLFNSFIKDPNSFNLSDLKKEFERINSVIKSLEVKPGLSVRYPNDKEYDSMDNNSALLVYSSLFDNGRYANDMRNHGKNIICVGYDEIQDLNINKKFYKIAKVFGLGSIKNYWNNNTPNLFCFFGWYGRSPGFMGLIDICATGHTTLFRHISLLIGQFLGSNSDPQNTDARTMSYLIWQVLKDKSKFHNWLYKIWLKKLIIHYPNGLKDVYNIYYNRNGDNPNHPIVKYTGIE